MQQIKVTELRKYLQRVLTKVQEGEEIQITLHGRAIARLVPEGERSEKAKILLRELRGTAWVGDVISPLEEDWMVGDDRL